MKQLPEKIQTQYQCEFCKKVYVYAKKCNKHESICYRNPDRICGPLGCDNTGIGEEVEGVAFPCRYCEIAEQLGGKSYIVRR